MENVMQAGFCALRMQPPLGLRIPGYYSVRLAEGTIDPLYLRATAFACGENKAVIFNCECIGLNAGAYEIIKKMVAEACQIDPESVYINCIHSHTSFIVVPAGPEMDDMDIHLLTIYQHGTAFYIFYSNIFSVLLRFFYNHRVNIFNRYNFA